MRYFDGEVWTFHFHTPGQLPDIGDWLNTTFSVFGKHWRGAAILAVGLNLVAGALLWFGLRFVLRDLAIINEELVNFDASVGVGLAVVAVLSVLLQGISWVALTRFLHRAHFHANPTPADALRHAVRRLGRYLVLLVGAIVAFVVFFLILGALIAAARGLGVVAVLASIPLGIYLMVKLAFVIPALAMAPRSSSIIGASAGVSSGRFWAVFGRLLLLIVGVGVASQILTAVLGPLAQPIQPEALADITVERGNQIYVRDFRFVDLLSSGPLFVVALAIGSSLQALTSLITTSGLVRLYLDSGAPAESFDNQD